MHILSNISESKGSQTMKFGHLIWYNKINIFTHKSAENEAGRLDSDPFLFFWKSFIKSLKKVSVTHDVTTSVNQLSNDLKEISDWAFQWKMSFNPDLSKQAQEVIFSRKLKNLSHLPLVFSSANFSCRSQKHLGLLLGSKLTFEEHYKTILNKTNRTIALLCKLQSLLPRAASITIYKAFVRPHLD